MERGEEEAVLAWLEGGRRIDATYKRGGVSGLTLLMGAANNGHERVVELLLRHGAEINLQSSISISARSNCSARRAGGSTPSLKGCERSDLERASKKCGLLSLIFFRVRYVR